MPHLLNALGSSPAPALIWHGNAERIELSHRVLGNWLTKCANALIAEAGLAPGDRVALDLPVHWRTVAWAGAASLVGLEVIWPDVAEPFPAAEATVSTNPDNPADLLILIPLPSLARSLDVPLPPGAIDGASDVMSQPDAPIFSPAPLATDLVAATSGSDVTQFGPVIITQDDAAAATSATLRALVAGQLVILSGDHGADPQALAQAEGITTP